MQEALPPNPSSAKQRILHMFTAGESIGQTWQHGSRMVVICSLPRQILGRFFGVFEGGGGQGLTLHKVTDCVDSYVTSQFHWYPLHPPLISGQEGGGMGVFPRNNFYNFGNLSEKKPMISIFTLFCRATRKKINIWEY